MESAACEKADTAVQENMDDETAPCQADIADLQARIDHLTDYNAGLPSDIGDTGPPEALYFNLRQWDTRPESRIS